MATSMGVHVLWVQVVRTDANVLVETDPVTLLEKPQMRYTDVMPNAKVCLSCLF